MQKENTPAKFFVLFCLFLAEIDKQSLNYIWKQV